MISGIFKNNIKLITTLRFRNRIRKLAINLECIFCDLIYRLANKLCKNIALTCVRNDGGGAQIHARLYCLSFANLYGFNYLNTEMHEVPHSFANKMITSPEFDLRWNSLLRFKNSSKQHDYPKTIQVKDSRELCLSLIKMILFGEYNKPILFEIVSMHRFANRSNIIVNQLSELARRDFFPENHKNYEKIVMHLRRGDVLEGNPSWESDSDFLNKLNHLVVKYPDCKIRIYSNSKFDLPLKFTNIATIDSYSEPFLMLSHIAVSDVFVMAKSSLSYIGALVSNGTIYCPDFWCARLNSWSSYDDLLNLSHPD